MKKLLAGMLALMLCVSAMPLNANAEGESINVKVTISDKDGNAVLQQKSVTVTDIDGDGALTINDALYIAHEENFEGGAEAGYESAKSEYGYGITKLWGTANGGSYGYYVNHIASTGVGDTINDGDYLDAFVYTDLENWSDKYAFFDALNAEVLPDISLPLTLSYAGYDENWNPVTLPVEGAVITINGEKTNFVTDANGYVEIRFPENGEYIVSAVSDNLNIVKPVFPVTVSGTLEEESVNVKVTISDKDGNAVLQQKSVKVTDIDGDGALTINDALYIAHEENFEGGAEAGYSAEKSEYGYGITKLWGTTNGGSYGYYVNHTASTGVGDPINDGDYLDAFVYTDLENWSDKYAFFDKYNEEIGEKQTLELTLSYAGYDENWSPVTLPVEGAVITVNGEKTDFVTDANGYVEVHFENAGEYVVSAVSDNLNIVKPVLPVTVNATGLEPTEPVSYGDVNLDGEVDVVDVLIVNKYLLGVAQLEGDSRINADVDKNGTIEDADAMNILKSVVKLVTLPISAE